MSRALKSVCEELGLISVVDDPATRAVAKNIIECAQRGIRDADTLRAIVLDELKSQLTDVCHFHARTARPQRNYCPVVC